MHNWARRQHQQLARVGNSLRPVAMKLLQKHLTKEGPGWVKLVPEEGE